MKSFRRYLMESVRTYRYKIKIAGSPDKNWCDLFCYNLNKFDPVKIGEPKSTPIQKDPYGFPGLENQSVTIIDVEFKYPATEPMIKQMARLQNYDENLVRMIQSDFDDSINHEVERYENQASHTPVLNHTELEDDGAAAKEASKEYGEQYLPRIMKDAKEDSMNMKYAAPKTPAAPDMRKTPGNDKSPMTSINRPKLPPTGASRKE
jgi:hypothetical protein